MNSFLSKPVTKIVFLFLSFVLVAFFLGGFVLNGLLRLQPQVANTIVIFVILLITHLAFKREGKSLSELGLTPSLRHLCIGVWGLILGGLFIIPLVYAVTWMKGYPVVFNQGFDLRYIFSGLWLLAPTVILEELAFRGICFVKTVDLTGVRKANVIFALAFIVSHWLNMGESGNLPQMMILLITGLGHLLYATALLKSGTLYFPIGIHLGNNWVTYFVFNGAAQADAAGGQTGRSLINIMAQTDPPAFTAEFLLTTTTTALFFLLFALAIRYSYKGTIAG
ncbi:MAG: CPBP family intramembrane glutamic endopeptidase [Prolixibacteraceae bacterium]